MGNIVLVGCVTVGRHRWTSTQKEMLQSIIDMLESDDKVRREEHKAILAMLNQLHYFQCHVSERIVVVWCGQNLLAEKLEKLETWLAHF